MECIILAATVAFKIVCIVGIIGLTFAFIVGMAAGLGYLFYFVFGDLSLADEDVDWLGLETPSSKKSKTVRSPKKKARSTKNKKTTKGTS